MNEKNAQLLSGLRDLCAFIEANDDFEFVTGQQPQVELSLATWHLCGSKEEHRAYVCDLARRVGKAEKVYRDSFFSMTHHFGPYVQFKAKGCTRFRWRFCNLRTINKQNEQIRIGREGCSAVRFLYLSYQC